jgi:hypothetical protein
MLEIFLNPGFLAAAGALVSAPIIIHLINRMRFKRIRWAAMEFLLKAQKRNRRRLIIEQLILLALRCILIALVGLLVSRFVGFSFADIGSKPALHLVLLDDTLSMQDEWKGEEGKTKNAFQVAKNDVLFEKIAKSVGQSSSGDKLYLLMPSKIATERAFQPKIYEKLNDKQKLEELRKDLEQLECSLLHVPVLKGVQKLNDLVIANPESRITLHILSDFRSRDWALPDAEPLHKMLVQLAKEHGDLKIRMIDTAGPRHRQAGQGGAPSPNENVGIVDIRAGTRVVGKNMPVDFTVTLANYSAREVKVDLAIFDEGTERLDADLTPENPIKIPAGSTDTKVTVKAMRFDPGTIKAGETHFRQITAQLRSVQRGPLENDGLAPDNVRHAVIEVRDKVPVLVIDGEGDRGRDVDMDSFFLQTAFISVPSSSYDVQFGDKLGGGVAANALNRADLMKYPTIFLANIRELTPKQLANLENYVREGGGVCFFMGPHVSAAYYNKNLYKGGQGVFPVPLSETYYPSGNDEALKPRYTGDYQLLLREDLFGRLDAIPIFEAVLKDETQKVRFKDLPIYRYHKVPRSEWRQEPGKIFELATLPNEKPASDYSRDALGIFTGPVMQKLMEDPELVKYQKGLDRHHKTVRAVVTPGAEKSGFALGSALEAMLQDKGKDKERADYPNLTEFWSHPLVGRLKKDVVDLRDQAKYGDPFIIAGTFGKGKVVAVMTTAGKEWNAWGGGCDATVLYEPFIWEMQNYLSSQGSDSGLTVGTPVQVAIDPELYRQKDRGQLKMSRFYRKPEPGKADPGKPNKEIPDSEQFGVGEEGKGLLTFEFGKNMQPGLYVANLHFADKPAPLAVYGHVFNVDTLKEGSLARIAYDDIERNVISEAPPGAVIFDGPGIASGDLVSRRTDLSESPWLYLLFIGILIAEQALAVHLSFHLKGGEGQALTPAAAFGQQRAAA